MTYHWEIIMHGEALVSCVGSEDVLATMRQLRAGNDVSSWAELRARKVYR